MKFILLSPLTSCSDEILDCKLQITDLNIQLNNIFTTLDHLKHNHAKRGIIHSIFNFLFGTSSSVEEMTAIKNNMEILKGNQDILSSQIQKDFQFFNLTFAETDKIRLLLKSLQKHIVEINSSVHCLSKELTTLIHDMNFFTIMFQLRSHLAML